MTTLSQFVRTAASAPLVSRAKQALRKIADPLRYRIRVRFQPRENHIYSHFYRFPNQYEVLLRDVLPKLRAQREITPEAPLEVAVFACCAGEEAYTLAYLLATRAEGLPLRLTAYDIVPAVVEQAKVGSYTREHVTSSPFVSDELVAGMFDTEGETCRVKKQFASLVSFELGDITDAAFMAKLRPSDLVFAQNVLFHLPRPAAKRAFENLVAMLRPGGALFINGMDTDMRVRLTKRYELEPVEERLAEIHEDARVDRGADWAHNYWGREPMKKTGDWVRKYGTIFIKKR